MPEVHARLSASGAKKWLNCPGSIQLESQFENIPSEFAQEGTTAHALAEAKLRFALKQIKRTEYAALVKKLDVNGEMEEYTDGYRDFVIKRYNHALKTTPDAKLLIEQKLDLSKWVPQGFGTGDAVIVGDGILEIVDLKYGAGVAVSADWNPQLRLYALGALDSFDFLYDIKIIRTVIYQPRKDNISCESITPEDLCAWGEIVAEKAKIAADDAITECTAGDHCDEGFCRARAVCRAYAEKRSSLAKLDFKPPAKLTLEEVAEVLEQSAKLKKWAELVNDYALDQAVNHEADIPGYKLVEGKSSRKYSKSDDVISKILVENGYSENDIFNRSIKCITEMEKLLGKTRFASLLKDCVIKPQGKLTLVPIEDKRPAVNSASQAADDFAEIIEKENK